MLSQVSKTSAIPENPFHSRLNFDGVIGFLEGRPTLFFFIEFDLFLRGIAFNSQQM
jgi:hypothetical protein